MSAQNTSSRTLSDMPVLVLALVMKDYDFETIQILRKVCRRFRSYIDENQCDSKIQKITSWENPPGIIWTEIDDASRRIKVKYQKEDNGCIVKFQGKEKLLQNQDFATVAGHDLGLLLSHQKSKMLELTVEFSKNKKLRLSVECLETTGGRFLAAFEPHLESLKSLLAVQDFKISGTNQERQILKVLPYLDPETLDIINFEFPFDHYNLSSVNMKIEKILELEQWKKVRKIRTDGLNFNASLEHFVHFKTGAFEVKQVSVEDLILLRETVLQRGACDALYANPTGYEFTYRHLIDKKNFVNRFGAFYPGWAEGNLTWFYKFPGTDRVLDISWCEQGKMFSWHSLARDDAPEDAFGFSD